VPLESIQCYAGRTRLQLIRHKNTFVMVLKEKQHRIINIHIFVKEKILFKKTPSWLWKFKFNIELLILNKYEILLHLNFLIIPKSALTFQN